MILLAVGAVVFALWALSMFRTLFALRRRGAARSGRAFPGVGETLHQWARWLRAPEDRTDRRRLAGVTLALFGWIALNASLPV